MSSATPTLHMICGKIASGKSMLSAQLGSGENTVVIAEDDWVNALFGEELTSMADYMRCCEKLRRIVGPHIASLLNAGVSVVLDFQANTRASRRWMREILDQTGGAHVLHVLDVPDAVCIARLHERNAQGDHPFAATEEQFHRISQHFEAPTVEEGFTIVTHEGHA